MITKIAWKNIWRAPLRSIVIITTIFLAVWAFIFTTSFTLAIVNGYVDKAIRFQTSHLQIHHTKYLEDKDEIYTLDNQVVEEIKKNTAIKAYSKRTIVKGMISTSRGVRGIIIKGVDPKEEDNLTNMSEVIIEGSYFTGKKNEILVSQNIATKLKLKLRKKAVLQFRDTNEEIIAGAFRVVGIFKTGNSVIDQGQIMVNRRDLNRLLGNEDILHEVAIKLNDANNLQLTEKELTTMFSGKDITVRNYKKISPDIELYESQIYLSLGVLLVIFMLTLVFGIVNTMMMAVLERTKELGMLMAIGMNKDKIFKMIVSETLFLGLISTPLGLLVGILTVNYFNTEGVNLSEFQEGIDKFGVTSIIYPEIEISTCIIIVIGVFITSLLASIYPALKAINLRPIEAIRKI